MSKALFSTHITTDKNYYENLIGKHVKEFGKDGVICTVYDTPKGLSDGVRNVSVTMVSNADESPWDGNLYGLL